mgnify:FL=1
MYLLPTHPMEANVRSSIDIFYTESVYPQQVKGYKSSQLDNETDAIMLLDAIHPAQNRSALENALRVSRITFSDTTSSCIDLIQYAWENKTPDQTVDYTRYWHGYLVWLKPLLLLMDYADLLNKFSYCFTFSEKPCTCKTKQQNTADINRACKYSECPICQPQIQLQEQLLTDMLQ